MDFKTRYKFDVATDLVGKGENARVYRAKDTVLERMVALKFFSANASEKHRVLDEIKKVIGFEHPNLCKYYDVEVLYTRNIFGEEERIEIGILEYLDKGDLKSFVAAHPEHTDKLLADVLQGLAYLHGRGIVHQYLKPQNILIKLVDDKPVAKITGFKNSKPIHENTITSGLLPGAIEYIAPEQFNPEKYGIGGKIATNLDLWRFGLVVYETLYPEPLFGSRSAGAEQIMANILNDAYLDKLDAAPPKYRDLLKRCLVKDASKRAQTAAELMPLLGGAAPSRPHVFVAQQAQAPKIVEPGDAKTNSSKPDVGKTLETSINLPVEKSKPFEAAAEAPPQTRGQEAVSDSEKNIVPVAVERAAENSTTGNGRATETSTTNLQHDARTAATEGNEANRIQPTPAEKRPAVPLAKQPTAAKPFNPGSKANKAFVRNKPVGAPGRGQDVKNSASWKSRVIGLLLIVVFFVLVLWQYNDGTAVPAGKEPASGPAKTAGTALPQLVEIPGGVFLMGFDGAGATEPEKPVHPVLLSDFSIGKYEVTIGEFRRFVAATGYQTTAEKEGSSFVYDGSGSSRKSAVNWQYDIRGNKIDSAQASLPVVHVSWYDAMAYCGWLSERSGKQFRLPTEAEWEYAAQGGKNGYLNRNDGNNLSEISWNGANSENRYHAVGGKKPNALGLHDMIGNVYEWCADWYDEKAYRSGKAENPAGPQTGTQKVIRGGSWYRDGGPEYYRPTIRFLLRPEDRGAKVGFRVCASAGK